MTYKGFYTQCLVILLRAPVSLRDIVDRLRAFEAQTSELRSSNWVLGNPSVVLPFRADVSGAVIVDLVDRPWPDHMGDAKRETELLAAWLTGHFGVTWPFSLKRACLQSWGWAEGKTVPLRNKAFLRVRSSYVFNGPDDAPLKPTDYEPLSELKFVTRVAAALAGLPQAISYFDPAGERVWAPKDFTEYFAQAEAQDSLPISIWCNLRHVNLKDRAEGWCLVDTMGMAQLDAADHEAIFPSARYKSTEVGELLLNMATYIAQNGPVIADGDTVDGPGDLHWKATPAEESQALPHRSVIRWLPMDGRPVPPAVITAPNPRTGA
ncbi:MAG TPA: DUF4261 domain-containing protein [Candidatus Udaeobacter sp.]|nr:DUF4261 domain-containing protein [Candidatus Udaeobacter sp.]